MRQREAPKEAAGGTEKGSGRRRKRQWEASKEAAGGAGEVAPHCLFALMSLDALHSAELHLIIDLIFL